MNETKGSDISGMSYGKRASIEMLPHDEQLLELAIGVSSDPKSQLFDEEDDVQSQSSSQMTMDTDTRALIRESKAKIAELEVIAEHERLAAEEAQKENARNLLNRVMKSPFDRNRKTIILKAFIKWSKIAPLHRKCDELAAQLQDRITAIASIRDSYLRDVVRVKHHLTKIQEFTLPGDDEPQLKKLTGHDMYDLHVVPSISLRSLIERAGENNDSSHQLYETMLQAGLVNPVTKKSFNAWERGKNFTKVMKGQRGRKFKLPDTKGESIESSVPHTHELFVRYCQECVGVMQFVKKWNFEVEDSMKYKHEGQIMQKEIDNLKMTITGLNQFIGGQEKRLVDALDENKTLKEGDAFMKQWSYQKEMGEREQDYKYQNQVLKEQVAFSQADIDARLFVFEMKLQEERKQFKIKEQKKNIEIKNANEVAAEEKRLRLDMLERLTISERQGGLDAQIIYDLQQETKNQKDVIKSLREEREKNRALIEKQAKQIEDLSTELKETQDSTANTIHDLKSDVAQLKEDVDHKDKQIEHMYDEMRDVRTKAEKVMSELEELREQKKAREATTKAIADAVARKPKYSLKVVAIAVRTAIRMSRAIGKMYDPKLGPFSCPLSVVDPGLNALSSSPKTYVYDAETFYPLGALGRREQIRRVQELLNGKTAELVLSEDSNSNLRKEVQMANQDIEKKKYQIKTLRENVSKGQERERVLGEHATKLKDDIKNLESTCARWAVTDEQRLLKISQIMKLLRRTQSTAHLQRDLILQYTKSVTLLQGVLFNTQPALELDPAKYVIKKEVIEEVHSNALSRAASVNVDADGKAENENESESKKSEDVIVNVDITVVTASGGNTHTEEGNTNAGSEAEPEAEPELPRMSESRKLEVSTKLYGGFTALVQYLKSTKKALPLRPFSLPAVPIGKEVYPVDKPSDSFIEKEKESSNLLLQCFLQDREKIEGQLSDAHTIARSVGDSMSNMRSQIIDNYFTMNHQGEEIQRLTSEVDFWTTKEKKRLREEEKKSRKTAKKNMKRQQTMINLNSKKQSMVKSKQDKDKDKGQGKSISEKNKNSGSFSSVDMYSPPSATSVAGGGEDSTINGLGLGLINNESPSSSPKSKTSHSPLIKAKTVPAIVRIQSAPEISAGGGGQGPPKREIVDLSFMDEDEGKAKDADRKRTHNTDIIDKKKNTGTSTTACSGVIKASELLSGDFSDEESDFNSSDDDSQETEDPNEAIIADMMKQIETLTEEVLVLHEELDAAHENIDILEVNLSAAYVDKNSSKKEMDRALVDYEAAIGRIRVLRQAVEDNYRERQKDIKEMKKEKEDEEKAYEKQRRRNRRHRGTNIACSVCAIRHEGGEWETDDVGAHTSVSTTLTLHHGLAEALHGDVVLLARPRNIQRKSSKPTNVNINTNTNTNTNTNSIPLNVDGGIPSTEAEGEGGDTNTKWTNDPHPLWSETDRDKDRDKDEDATTDVPSERNERSKFRTMRSIPDNNYNNNNNNNNINRQTVTQMTSSNGRTHSAGAADVNSAANRTHPQKQHPQKQRPKSSHATSTGGNGGNGGVSKSRSAAILLEEKIPRVTTHQRVVTNTSAYMQQQYMSRLDQNTRPKSGGYSGSSNNMNGGYSNAPPVQYGSNEVQQQLGDILDKRKMQGLALQMRSMSASKMTALTKRLKALPGGGGQGGQSPGRTLGWSDTGPAGVRVREKVEEDEDEEKEKEKEKIEANMTIAERELLGWRLDEGSYDLDYLQKEIDGDNGDDGDQT